MSSARGARKRARVVGNANPVDLNDRVGEYIRELTAIHAHMDALALAVAGEGAEAFRDHELSAILFDLEERLMHVRDALVSAIEDGSAVQS